MKQEHHRKMIAPIVVTVLICAYYMLYFFLLMTMLDTVWRIFLGVIPLALAAAMIGVCIQRIHEIQRGEEDDLSKY